MPNSVIVVWEWLEPRIGDRWLHRDAGLEFIELDKTSVDDRWLARLNRCRKLTQLELNPRQIGPGLAELSELPELHEINVVDITSDTPLRHLNLLPQLKRISLVFRADSGFPPATEWNAVASLPNLEMINIWTDHADLVRKLRFPAKVWIRYHWPE